MRHLAVTVSCLLGALALALAAPTQTLEAGPSTLRVLDPPWRAGSLSFQVDNGTPVVHAVDVFAASGDWKQRLFDFRDAEISTVDTFAGRRVLLRRQGGFGLAEQEATLTLTSLPGVAPDAAVRPRVRGEGSS